MDRERASERFWIIYALGFGIGLVFRATDPPRAVVLPAAIAYGAAIGWFGLHWLLAAIRDGSLRRALPEYGWAFFGLLVIALGCGAVTLVVLLASGGEFTGTDISGGALLGTVAVLAGWWLMRGRHAT